MDFVSEKHGKKSSGNKISRMKSSPPLIPAACLHASSSSSASTSAYTRRKDVFALCEEFVRENVCMTCIPCHDASFLSHFANERGSQCGDAGEKRGKKMKKKAANLLSKSSFWVRQSADSHSTSIFR
jgi:hypothetical protein